jgi:hypothetical protein
MINVQHIHFKSTKRAASRTVAHVCFVTHRSEFNQSAVGRTPNVSRAHCHTATVSAVLYLQFHVFAPPLYNVVVLVAMHLGVLRTLLPQKTDCTLELAQVFKLDVFNRTG